MVDTTELVDYVGTYIGVTRLIGPATDTPHRRRVRVCILGEVAYFKDEHLAIFVDELDEALAWVRDVPSVS